MRILSEHREMMLFIAVMLLMCSGMGANRLCAQERIILKGIGYSSQLDTYLSQEHFRGAEGRLILEETRMHKNSPLSHIIRLEGSFSTTKPKSDVSSELSAIANIQFGMHRHMQLTDDIDVAFGGVGEAFIGGIYNTRNGNNPAQLKAGLDVAPSVLARYEFEMWKKHFRVNYEGRLPLLGAQFSPAYGQSYYELFARGNYDHNICLTSPFNALSYTQTVTLDIPIKKHFLRVGYLGDYRQTKLNSLRYHDFYHSFIFGWTL